MDAATTSNAKTPTGIEDVVRSVRAISRTARNLGEVSAEVVEREIAMAIRISDQLRDDVFSKETLQEARKQNLTAQLREDGHKTLDLVADVGAVMFLTATRFLENFADQPRPALTTSAGAEARRASWHSVKTEVYHNNAECRTGNNIEAENRKFGSGGKPLCKECARLNAMVN
jgi:hypothetical protein